MRENEKLKTYALTEIKNIKIHGRTTGCLAPLTLFWTGSALELNAKCSELWIEVESVYEACEPWISIVINGAPVSRRMLNEGRYWICVFRGMSENVVKNVRVVKDTQAMSGDPACSLQIHSVRADGEFLPVEEKPYKLEFIGDSITSGEGAIGATIEEDWISMWFSATDNYAYRTAKALNADYRVISQSGWGVLTGWDNNPHDNIPDYYEQVCGILSGDKNEALGALKENDFSSWQPDAVIVNLGTNDGGAFRSPEWKDAVTGESHKQRMNEDGSFHEEDLKSFEKAAESFLVKLRRYNEKAHIIWAYGMLGIPMLPSIQRAVESYQRNTGDQKVSVVQLSETTQETVGARNHPGLPAHQKAAQELTEHIKKILGI